MTRRFVLSIAATAVQRLAASSGYLDVPYVRQPPEGCGAAVVWMLIGYWQPHSVRPSVEEIHRQLYSQEDRGVRAAKLSRFLTEHRFRVFDFAGRWSDLEEQIAKGRPVIVCLRPTNDPARHYVVVAGLDGTHALVNDPADRKLRRIDRPAFEKSWGRAGNWMLLAVPASNP